MNLQEALNHAKQNKNLVGNSFANVQSWLQKEFCPDWVEQSIRELVETESWDELNERFHTTLGFGTGGIRGRTLGKIITKAELGSADGKTWFEHPCVGTNCLNDINVIQSAIGLYRYCQTHLEDDEIPQRPRLVIAHDTRFFSKHFCELISACWTQLGGDAFIYEGPRSTPQLSFSVRYLKCTAGIMITASHNPAFYNGIKVYFSDGGQVTGIHAKKIMDSINKVDLLETVDFLDKEGFQNVIVLSPFVDEAYQEIVKDVVLDAEVLRNHKPKSVFSALHGTGSATIPDLIRYYDLDCTTVSKQMKDDPWFSTVEKPNPEYPEAFAMGIEKAKEVDADLIITVDPDADRIGVVIRDEYDRDSFVHLNGNIIFAMLLEYRIVAMRKLKWLKRKKELNSSFTVIKTFVTTNLVESIAKAHGLKVVNTLTGFKWIGEKLLDYEMLCKSRLRQTQGISINFDKTTNGRRREFMARHSSFCVLAGEESHGYLFSQTIRDKDANGAFLMVCELAAYLHREGLSFQEYIDAIYLEYGYYFEDKLEIYYEGASGMQKIKKILDFFQNGSPSRLGGKKVIMTTDFSKDAIFDPDGKKIPPEMFFVSKLLNGYSIAIRGSGTEPKIKFYIFAHEQIEKPEDLAEIKLSSQKTIEDMKIAIKKEIETILA